MKKSKPRLIFSSGASCLASSAAAISISDTGMIWVKNRAGEPIITVRCDDYTSACVEVQDLNKQFPDMRNRIVMSNGSSCVMDIIDGTDIIGGDRVVVKMNNGDILVSVRCDSHETASAELHRINQSLT